MSGAIGRTTAQLPGIFIAGAGPGGSVLAHDLQVARAAGKLDVAFQLVDARGPVNTVPRNIAYRSQSQEILAEITGTHPGRNGTIGGAVNGLRAANAELGIETTWNSRVLEVVDDPALPTVRITTRGPDGRTQTHEASGFVNATGREVPIVDRSGAASVAHAGLRREVVGESHPLVTRQYAMPSQFGDRNLYGVYDRVNREAVAVIPVGDGSKEVVVYLDLPVGAQVSEADALARFAKIEQNMGFENPVSPAQFFDARPHHASTNVAGRVASIGDAVGNADPYSGAGFAGSVVDARKMAAALVDGGGSFDSIAATSRESVKRHGRTIAQGKMMAAMRDISFRPYGAVDSIDTATIADAKKSRLVSDYLRWVYNQPVYESGADVKLAAKVGAGVAAAGGGAYLVARD